MNTYSYNKGFHSCPLCKANCKQFNSIECLRAKFGITSVCVHITGIHIYTNTHNYISVNWSIKRLKNIRFEITLKLFVY